MCSNRLSALPAFSYHPFSSLRRILTNPSRKRLFLDYEGTPIFSSGEQVRQRFAPKSSQSSLPARRGRLTRACARCSALGIVYPSFFTAHVAHQNFLLVSSPLYLDLFSISLQRYWVSSCTFQNSSACISAVNFTETLRPPLT